MSAVQPERPAVPRRRRARWWLMAVVVSAAVVASSAHEGSSRSSVLVSEASDVLVPAASGSHGSTVAGGLTGSQGVVTTTKAARRPAFTMRTRVVGGALAPGLRRTLRVTVHNKIRSRIRVLSLRVTVRRTGVADCRRSWVRVGSYTYRRGRGRIARAGGRTRLTVPITLVNTPTVNQDACRGVTFRLKLRGTARQLAR